MNKPSEIFDEEALLEQFNNRNSHAFSSIYSHYYHDFHYYTSYLYDGTTVESEDIIHDIFLELWQNKQIRFDRLIKIKGYVIIAIKNGFKNYKNHSKYQKIYRDSIVSENDFGVEVFECEFYSMLDEALSLLPSECAKVFKLYIEGYKPDEIAHILDKKIQNVYNTKQDAIATLRCKLSHRKSLLFILLFLS